MQTRKEIQFSLTLQGEQPEMERLSSLIQSELMRISKFPGVEDSNLQISHNLKPKSLV